MNSLFEALSAFPVFVKLCVDFKKWLEDHLKEIEIKNAGVKMKAAIDQAGKTQDTSAIEELFKGPHV